jgi:hypothetical protein
MNLPPSTATTIRGRVSPVKSAGGKDGSARPFVTLYRPFVTRNIDSSHSGWLPRHRGRTIAGMLAEGVLAISLVVRIYDGYHVPEDHLAKARTTVAGILMKGAGVGVTWPACPCLTPVAAGELVVRIAAASPASPPGALGFSLIDVGNRTGTLATVYADRVQAMAALAGVDHGELLGRVIAHEIAHLLIGTNDHSARGLMRGGWKASEVASPRRSDWLLSRAEGREIRQAVSRRSSERPPALLAADAEAAPDLTQQ